MLENGKQQKLTYFTSDPFQLSVAIVLDLGMADVALQKVNQTYSALVGAFSPYDEFALYTYSSTVSQVTDFTGRPERLTAALNQMKLVRGRNNGPPVLGGPLGLRDRRSTASRRRTAVHAGNTPPKEAHVLNDAILRAALDLSKRDRTRRKVIFVISDGRERGSQASYKRCAEAAGNARHSGKGGCGRQRRAAGLQAGRETASHLPDRVIANILPKYTNATGGGDIFTELSRNAIEDAYAQITSEARNQYTLGYSPKAVAGSSAYRGIEVLVNKQGAEHLYQGRLLSGAVRALKSISHDQPCAGQRLPAVPVGCQRPQGSPE